MIATRHSLDDARVVHKEALSLLTGGNDVFLVLACNDHFEYTRNDGSVIAIGKPPNGECAYMGFKVLGLPKRKGLWGKWKTFLELSKMVAEIKADVYHAHEPDLALAIAIRAKHILRKRGFLSYVVHDMHEYPPGGPADRASNFLKLTTLLVHILWNKISMKYVDHVFTANNIVRGYALVLSFRKSVDTLYNGPSMKLFPQPAAKSFPAKSEKLLLCHEGSLPFSRGLKEMVEAVYCLRDKVCLRIVGDVYGDERIWLDHEINDKQLHDTIIITGWLPYEKVNDAINDCHVGLILFRDTINNRLAGPPNKLFNYMNAGLPVLSVDFPEMKQLIMEEKCGILINDQSVKSIINAVEILLANPENLSRMSRNGLRSIRNRYSWEVMEKKLLLAYEELTKTISLN